MDRLNLSGPGQVAVGPRGQSTDFGPSIQSRLEGIMESEHQPNFVSLPTIAFLLLVVGAAGFVFGVLAVALRVGVLVVSL